MRRNLEQVTGRPDLACDGHYLLSSGHVPGIMCARLFTGMKSHNAHNHCPRFTEEKTEAQKVTSPESPNWETPYQPGLGPLSLWLQSHRVTPEHLGLRERNTSQNTCCSGIGLTFVPWDQLRGSECTYWGSWPLWEAHQTLSPFPSIMYTYSFVQTLKDLPPALFAHLE